MAAYTTIDDPELYFQTVIYTGGQSGGGMKTQAVTFDGEEDMSPNMVWIKSRSNPYTHVLADSVRGVDEVLRSDKDYAALDGVADSSGGVSIFGSNGFTAAGNDVAWVAESPSTYVAWCWKESATAGFDIVSYTGNGTSDTDISHNLSAVPRMIIFKDRDTVSNWQTGHASLGWTKTVYLNLTNASNTDTSYFNDTAPTSSVFTLGDNVMSNSDTKNYIAYCFAEKQGFSKFGSYTGNGNADGAFVYTGFRPAFVMVKESSTTNSWRILDNKRSPINVANLALKADMSSAEFTADHETDFLSNGFKARTSDSNINRSSGTYIYMAFAEAPFVNSNGVPNNAR